MVSWNFSKFHNFFCWFFFTSRIANVQRWSDSSIMCRLFILQFGSILRLQLLTILIFRKFLLLCEKQIQTYVMERHYHPADYIMALILRSDIQTLALKNWHQTFLRMQTTTLATKRNSYFWLDFHCNIFVLFIIFIATYVHQ